MNYYSLPDGEGSDQEHDDSPNQEIPTNTLNEARDVVAKYENKYGSQLSEKEKAELDSALAAIASIQKACWHSYQIIPMFTQVWRICSKCGHRDTYNHFD